MKTMVFTLLALIGGFLGGIVLTEIVSIISLMVFDGTSWLARLRFFPAATAVLCAAIYIVRRRKSK